MPNIIIAQEIHIVQTTNNITTLSSCVIMAVLLEIPTRIGGRAVEGTGLENRQSNDSWVRIPPPPLSWTKRFMFFIKS